VETKNLDGETNLKSKEADKYTRDLIKDDQSAIEALKSAKVSTEGPNASLYTFEGTLEHNQKRIVFGEQ